MSSESDGRKVEKLKAGGKMAPEVGRRSESSCASISGKAGDRIFNPEFIVK
jgi:hypothetical protein